MNDMTKLKTFGKWTFRLLPVCLIALVALGFLVKHLSTPQRAKRFITHWAVLFSQCNSLADVESIAQEERPDLIWMREFENGEWVIARTEHACTSGAGFDATVFRDSSGSILYQTTHHFCGYEGLCGDLRRAGATNLVQFYASLDDDVDLKKVKGTGPTKPSTATK